MMLTNTKISNIKPNNSLLRIKDSMGLYLYVGVGGTKTWVHRYKFKGKEFTIKLGNYPNLSLQKARQIRDKNKSSMQRGINPVLTFSFQTDKLKTFNDIFDEWMQFRKSSWTEDYFNNVFQRYEKYIKNNLGMMEIENIKSNMILKIFKEIESTNKLDTLQKVKGIMNQVFKYANGMGYASENPTQNIPTYVFRKKIKRHYSYLTNRNEISILLNSIDRYQGSFVTKNALKIAPHIFLRPSELVGLRWSDIDFLDMTINISAERMKNRRRHFIPISIEVYEILLEIKSYQLGGKFVFPSPLTNSRHISAESLRVALRRMGFKKEQITTHGFRHMASTLLHEFEFDTRAIEMQLSHCDKNTIRATYNHSELKDYRKKMMDYWSKLLEEIKNEKNFTSF